jgi:hypothetical protein
MIQMHLACWRVLKFDPICVFLLSDD